MYKKIADILDNSFGESWFMDSGSLLGVVRDGKFLSSDRGIDISVIVDSYDEGQIKIAVEEMVKLGYIVSKYEWDGIAYKYCFAPNLEHQNDYAIDFHMFIKVDDLYYCPQVSLITLKRKYNRIAVALRSVKKGNEIKNKPGIVGRIQYFISHLYRYTFKYFGQPLKMKYYAKKGAETFFWVIPAKIFKGTSIGYEGLRVLKNPEEYLTYRYGNWEVPVSDWNTIRDDGGLRRCSVDEIDNFIHKK